MPLLEWLARIASTWVALALLPSQLSAAPFSWAFAISLQGKKQAGRLQALAECYAALETCLQLLGLWAEQPQDVLLELRQLALKR